MNASMNLATENRFRNQHPGLDLQALAAMMYDVSLSTFGPRTLLITSSCQIQDVGTIAGNLGWCSSQKQGLLL